MASPAAAKWKYALQVEKELGKLIEQDRPTYTEFDHLIHEMRIACEHTVFLDIEYADKVGAGKHLWDAHTRINTRYRKLLDRFRKGENKKLVIERRKIEKHYVDFLKTSTVFYKGYIQRLASHFGGIPELRRIANSLELSTLSLDEPKRVSPSIERLIKLTCHATLLRLGDLSRYRNQIRTNSRSWDPALALYQLANDLHPASGYGYNQIAVVALAEENHLDAVYYIYRAVTAEEPYPLAKDNLEKEFKKITAGWDKRRNLPKQDSLSTLARWFCLLQAKFYEGVDFQTHDELENEVLSRMTLLLKEQSFPLILEKFVLVSLAAEYYAHLRVREENSDEAITSYYFCLGFNVRMMFALLQVLLPELEEHSSGEEHPSDIDRFPIRERISTIARRVIPAIRLYTVWIAITARVLNADIGPSSLSTHKKELWNLYGTVLTRLAHYFPADDMHRVPYLLEEDESTVGFPPLQDGELQIECNLQVDEEGKPKPRKTDRKVGRQHPNLEMESRILDILVCSLRLQQDGKIPINFFIDSESKPVFQYKEDGLSDSGPITLVRQEMQPPTATDTNSSASFGTHDHIDTHTSAYTSFSNQNVVYPSYETRLEESVGAPESNNIMDDSMQQMVDSLTAPSRQTLPIDQDETSYGMCSGTADKAFASLRSPGMERSKRTPKMLPSLPGYYSSAFTPKPNELQPVTPIRPNAARQVSPLSLSTEAERMQAAVALDEACFGGLKMGSWGRKSSQQSFTSSIPADHLKQSALVKPYLPSSDFSQLSSLYQNSTPMPRHNDVNNLAFHGDSTVYAGASDFDRATMLRSSIWANGQPTYRADHYSQTPPGGQGG